MREIARSRSMDESRDNASFPRMRVANACDACKARKVKCDANLPCGYCVRRQRPQLCHYSPQRRQRNQTTPKRLAARLHPAHRGSEHAIDSVRQRTSPTTIRASVQSAAVNADESVEDEAEVPREGRLLCDAQGKLVFIGDCAPLSFFQTIRQIVTLRVDANAFEQQTSRHSVLENTQSIQFTPVTSREPVLSSTDITQSVSTYLLATSGLLDLFEDSQLRADMSTWATTIPRPHDVVSAVNYLIIAIGYQSADEQLAASCFEHGRTLALDSLNGHLSIATIQAFTLITLYMLRACQINGSFLFFGIAARAAYSIGIHRTEINARFGSAIHRQRDRLWKSLRGIDLFLSISMGRPPACSDKDCTVPYSETTDDSQETVDLLNASVQALLINEVIVLDVYSRKKISRQLTEGISQELRHWSSRWLQPLKTVVMSSTPQADPIRIVGACQVLCAYYHAVMLVSRPFLMYILCKNLADTSRPVQTDRSGADAGKAKLADACIDAAGLLSETVLDLIERDVLPTRMPLIVSWLFTSALVLGVGLLGGFGRILEKYARMSIKALEFFAKNDSHASQYSLISQSLLSTALQHVEDREKKERLQITESSAKLFGLLPRQLPLDSSAEPNASEDDHATSADIRTGDIVSGETTAWTGFDSPFFRNMDPSLFSFPDIRTGNDGLGNFGATTGETDQMFGALNLFPLLEGGGHIDLAYHPGYR